MGAVVAAFLSWAGFEGCAALGQETDDPKRNIPRALTWAVALTAVLFIMVMFAQTIGYGTNAAGLHDLRHPGKLAHHARQELHRHVVLAGDLLRRGDLGLRLPPRLGRHFGSPDVGLQPRRSRSQGLVQALPQALPALNAIMTVTGVSMVLAIIGGLTKHPVVGTGDAALDYYFYYATIGAMTLDVRLLHDGVGHHQASSYRAQGQGRRGDFADPRRRLDGPGLLLQRQEPNGVVGRAVHRLHGPWASACSSRSSCPDWPTRSPQGSSSEPEEAGPVGKDLLAPGIEAHLPTSGE